MSSIKISAKALARLPARRKRGSVLLAAAVMAFCIAIALTSYLKVAVNSVITADRSYYQNAAVNLAEVGVEEAIYSYNKLNDVASAANAWTPYGWTIGGDNSVTRTLSGFSVGPGVTGTIKVYCSLYNPTSTQKPKIVAMATVSFPSGPPLSKYVEVTLRRRSLFPEGMLVRRTIDANGGDLSLDSWDSLDDGDPSTPMVTYSTTSRRANATLATASAADNAIDIGNGNVYGYISTAQNSDGTGGAVKHGPTSVLTGNFSSTEYDADRVSHDFEVTTFPTITVPTGNINLTANIGATTLPRVGDSAAADGKYYYNFGIGTSVSFNGGTLNITSNVVLILTNHSGVSALDVGGGGGIAIASGSSLKIYTNGDISLTGSGGLSNGNSEPSTCVFYGTNGTAGGQSFTIKGNGHTSVSLYGPNAAITMSGGGSGGDFYGAIVGDTVRMNGTTRFHYDEALSKLYVGEPWGVSKWRELETTTDRASYAANLAF